MVFLHSAFMKYIICIGIIKEPISEVFQPDITKNYDLAGFLAVNNHELSRSYDKATSSPTTKTIIKL